MGAWIETYDLGWDSAIATSLPMWERGLKLDGQQITKDRVRSLPMWERGLKHNTCDFKRNGAGRSLCGSVD